MARRSLGVVGASLVLLSPRPAAAQNSDQFYFSDEAALTAGAMTAVPGDPGAVWYNPAGLGALEHPRVNINGSVIGVRIRPVDVGLTSAFDGNTSSLDYGGTDFISTPTAATTSFDAIGGIVLGGGVFHTRHDIRAALGQETVTSASGRSLTQSIQRHTTDRKLYGGGAYGYETDFGLRIGAGLFLGYAAHTTTADLFVGNGGGSEQELLGLSLAADATVFGLLSTAGIQYDALDDLHLGVTFRAPELQVHTSTTSNVTQIVAEPNAAILVVDEDSVSSERVRWITPAELIVGVAYEPNDWLRVAGDVGMVFPLDQDDVGRAHQTTVHGHLGMLLKPWDEFHLGVGAFADPATTSAIEQSIGAIRAHYFGGTLGGILRTPFGDGPIDETPHITTSIAVRYSVGIGDALTVHIADEVTTATQPITTHDVMPYLGASVLY